MIDKARIENHLKQHTADWNNRDKYWKIARCYEELDPCRKQLLDRMTVAGYKVLTSTQGDSHCVCGAKLKTIHLVYNEDTKVGAEIGATCLSKILSLQYDHSAAYVVLRAFKTNIHALTYPIVRKAVELGRITKAERSVVWSEFFDMSNMVFEDIDEDTCSTKLTPYCVSIIERMQADVIHGIINEQHI